MNTKRIVRWGVVLFLLAALPVMTAALAQAEEPLPAVIERGESATVIPWTNDETEPNDTPNEADWPPDYGPNTVVGGTIGSSGDVDYWQLMVEEDWQGESWAERHSHFPVLIDIDAQSINSPVDTVICLYADDGVEVGCNDNTDTPDSMLYFNFQASRSYYLKVQNKGNGGGSSYRYQINFSVPLMISAAAAKLGTGYVDGIPFKAGDILAYSDFNVDGVVYPKWVLLFDLSDLGVTGNLTNLSGGWRNSDYLLVGFAANATLPGISGTVTPWEVVVFDPTTIGPTTAGTFSRWWNGRNQQLTTSGEKIDAIDWPSWAGFTQLFVSTAGAAAVYGGPATTTKLADEDIGIWRDDPADQFHPRWELYMDGSAVGINHKTEDIMAFSLVAGRLDNGDPVTIIDRYLVLKGSQKDIYNYVHDDELGDWSYLEWRGSDHGWNYNIDAIQFQYWLGHQHYD